MVPGQTATAGSIITRGTILEVSQRKTSKKAMSFYPVALPFVRKHGCLSGVDGTVEAARGMRGFSKLVIASSSCPRLLLF